MDITANSNMNVVITDLQLEYAKAGVVSISASGNAISKAITVSEIMKRKDGSMKVESRLYKVPMPVKNVDDEEDGNWKNTAIVTSEKFLPCLEITLRR